MESIENSMDPRVKEKHEEEHEDSKREKNQNNQSLYWESQDYQLDLNPLEAIKQKKWTLWWRTMYGKLMNESIARSRTKGSPRWRERTMMIACSRHTSTWAIISSAISMGWSLHQINVRNVLRIIEQEAYVEQPQGFEVYQKEILVCRWKKILYRFK